MPVKRRISKVRDHRITPEAVAAFRAGDYLGLHQALGLRPFEVSPLFKSTSPFGVDQADRPAMSLGSCWDDSVEQAQTLQRLLVAAARK